MPFTCYDSPTFDHGERLVFRPRMTRLTSIIEMSQVANLILVAATANDWQAVDCMHIGFLRCSDD